MSPCHELYHLLLCLYDTPFDALHAWATPGNLARLDALLDGCTLNDDEELMLAGIRDVLAMDPQW